MDFGIARRLSHQSGDTFDGNNRQWPILGTPDWRPEQFQGKEPTPATDVYALGVVFYELATGKRPVRDDLEKSRNGKAKTWPAPPPYPGIPRRFDEVVCKCLEYDPKRRYQSAREVERAIRLPAVILGIQRNPLRAVAGVIRLVILLSSLLLVPAIGERAREYSSPALKNISRYCRSILLAAVRKRRHSETVLWAHSQASSRNLGASNQTLFVVPASKVRARKVNDPPSALREFGATIVVKGTFERNGEAARLRLT